MSEGRVAVWEVVICIVDIETEGGMGVDGPGSAVVGGQQQKYQLISSWGS